MKLAFRADASVETGSGHVMRCLALADELKRRGANTLFICRQAPGHLGDLVTARGHGLAWLPAGGSPETDAADALALLAGGEPWDWLVVDHYGLGAEWERALRARTRRILAIDDLADRPHDCDVLLDQNHYLDAGQRYAALLPLACEQLLGPRYALLQAPFAKARRGIRERDGRVRHLLICFGGTDPGNATGLAVEGFLAADMDGVVADVVVGGGNPHWKGLNARYADVANLRLRRAVDDMAETMVRADLFLGAGGSLSWERAALGLPGITLALADNQRQLSLDLAEAGAGMHLGDIASVRLEALAEALHVLSSQPELLRAMGRRLLDFTDGRGAQRVSARLLPPQVTLRPALGEDGEPLYAWRNHPLTRRFFHDPSPIELDGHREWFARLLRDPERILLVAEQGGASVGVLRYDYRGGEADVSLYLDPARHGEGLGSALLKAGLAWLAAHRPDIRRLYADVLPENAASRALFAGAGFREAYSRFQLDMPDAGEGGDHSIRQP